MRLSVCLCACTLGREVAHSVVQALCRPRTFIFASTVNEMLSIACLRLAAVFTQCTIQYSTVQYSTECVCVQLQSPRGVVKHGETKRNERKETKAGCALRNDAYTRSTCDVRTTWHTYCTLSLSLNLNLTYSMLCTIHCALATRKSHPVQVTLPPVQSHCARQRSHSI